MLSHIETATLSFILGLLFSFAPSQSSANAISCNAIFSPTQTQDLTKIDSLDSLGKAMTQGIVLNEAQADIFEVYRKVYFGDANTNVNGKTLSDVIKIQKQHPELEKPHFTEYNISTIEKVYETPESLAKFLKSQTSSAGQVRSNLFQIEANLGAWKKILQYQDPTTPEGFNKEQQKEFQRQSKDRFEKYLNRLINKTNRDLLADLKNDDLDYNKKAIALFKTLKYIQVWMHNKGRNTQPIRQAMVDLVHTVGYGNQATQSLLKSKNGLDKIEGYKKLLDERDALAMDLGYAEHFHELISTLQIEFPAGLSKNEAPSIIIRQLEQEVLHSNFTTKPTDTLRVRSLSIQEAPFRSCLGGSDCSTRTYFSKALDPNFNYFTMTNSQHQSNGHVTVVLGTVLNRQTGQQDKVAFVDKLQNVPNQKIEVFLTAVAKSLNEKGYKLALPAEVGDHNGLSNMDVIRHFVQNEIVNRLKESRDEFTPHQNQYNFENRYSRAYIKPKIVIYEPKTLDTNTEITKGQEYKSTQAPAAISKEQLIQEFLKLKDSDKEEDQIRFIKSGQFVESMEKLGLYTKQQFNKDLKLMLENKQNSLSIRKNVYYEFLMQDVDNYGLIELSFSPSETQQINSELKQWKISTDQKKLNIINLLSQNFLNVAFSNDSSFLSLIKSPVIDINVKDNNGKTVLMLAIEKNKYKIVNVLLETPGFDINAKDNNGKTALNIAASYGRFDYVELLLKSPKTEFEYSELKNLIKDINNKDNFGKTALHQAAYDGHENIFELLLKTQGADATTTNKYGMTMLHTAAEKGHRNIVESLLKKTKIDVNSKDSNGQTPLHAAALYGRQDIIELLLKSPDIDINAKDKDGRTPLHLALIFNQKGTAELLLAQKGIDIYAKSNNDETILFTAASKGLGNIVDHLLRYPEMDINQKNNKGQSILDMAFNHNVSPKELEFLLHIRGFEFNSKDSFLRTPLFQAVIYKKIDFIEFLLKFPGFDINAKDAYGQTALSIAKGNTEIQDLLRAHGATE